MRAVRFETYESFMELCLTSFMVFIDKNIVNMVVTKNEKKTMKLG